MPSRGGSSPSGGSAGSSGQGGSSGSGGGGLPANPEFDTRVDNGPAEYRASESITFVNGFTSGEGDSFETVLGGENASVAGNNGGGGSSVAAGSGEVTGSYRYGFNGKENDGELSGDGNQYNYGFRIYDPRLGRFKSVDPLTRDYPELTPYQYSSNNPVWNTDLDGLEGVPYTDPKQILYQGGADISRALGSAWDRITGFFSSNKTEIDKPVNNAGTSVVTTRETTVYVGGSMERWITAGQYSGNNTMPTLKFSNFFGVETKTDTKVEMKQTVQAGNVKWETKVNVDGSSAETKVTVQNVKFTRSPVPLDVSAARSVNKDGSKTKIEVKTSTKPVSVGGAVEVAQDKRGNVTGGTVGATFQVQTKTPSGTTIKNTTTVGKTF